MKKLLSLTVLAFLTAGMLILSGCPDKTEDEDLIDSALVGSWDNEIAGPENRTFNIKSDGSFTATLSPAGADGRGSVEGVLNKEGSFYEINKMYETTGKGWGELVGSYNKKLVKITLSNNNTVFTLTCPDEPMVEQFFGGTYNRVN